MSHRNEILEMNVMEWDRRQATMRKVVGIKCNQA